MPFRFTPQRIRRLATFVVVMAVQFGVFEAAMRIWGSSEAAPSFQGLFLRDSDVGFRLKPGARIRYKTVEFDTEITVNNVGVRDDQDVHPKTAGERRIVVLGDSLVLSVQVPAQATFTKLLERRLNSGASPYPYRVLNAGVQGYSPIHELLWFRKLGAALEPDIVIVALFVANDAEEAFAARALLDPSARPVTERLTETVTVPLRRLVRQSMVLQVFRTRVLAVTNRFRPSLAPPEPPLQSYAANPPAWIQQGLDITRDAVRDIARHAATFGARTVVILLPARFQLMDEDYVNMQRAVAESGGELLRDAASQRFAAAVSGIGLPWLDLLPALRAAAPGPDLFFERSAHLTPRGHDIVAAALQQFLEGQRLVGDAVEAGGDR